MVEVLKTKITTKLINFVVVIVIGYIEIFCQANPQHALQESSLVHNCQNYRSKDALNGPKCDKTANSDHTCKFGFSVSSNMQGFFIRLKYNSDNSSHIGHPKPINRITIPIPTQLLSEEEKEDIRNIKESLGNNSPDRNFMHGKFGKFIQYNESAIPQSLT